MILVDYQLRGDSAWLCLNRPDMLNALSGGLVEELREALRRYAADDAVKVVVAGAGGAFCAGHDLTT